jgi:hypothetical protein
VPLAGGLDKERSRDPTYMAPMASGSCTTIGLEERARRRNHSGRREQKVWQLERDRHKAAVGSISGDSGPLSSESGSAPIPAGQDWDPLI